jgi:uncharacterized protein YodC (DUF2158 family)
MGMKWAIGDKVRLVSGGPVMTVVGASENHSDTQCRWFAPSGGLKEAWHPDTYEDAFPAAALEEVA